MIRKEFTFQERFAVNEDSGAFVMTADAVDKRFDDRTHEVALPKNRITMSDIYEHSEFGMSEYRREQRLIARAYEIRGRGFRPPTRILCRVYGPDALSRWVELCEAQNGPDSN
ncbi:MAG: hypothetical protein PHT32_06460 [Candidatus Omnitrophica bacterium]|nr:hypothetical protein [Candidatus Omnitrophota bacterium]